jgi:hypothetical protein
MKKRHDPRREVVAVVMYAFWAVILVALLAYALAQVTR